MLTKNNATWPGV